MPEYVLDSRGRRRSVLLSVKECAGLVQKIDGFRDKLGITTFPADDEERAVAVIEQRVRAAAAVARTAVAASPRGSSAGVAERVRVCGARVVSGKGKTVACLLTLREWNLLVDHLEWLDDSAYMQEALAEGRGEFVELHELLRQLGLEQRA